MNLSYQDLGWITTRDSVRIANDLIHRSSKDAPIRGLANKIIDPVRHMRAKDAYPKAIQEWVLENVNYIQETHNFETLQGPYTTLPPIKVGGFQFEGIGAGDCDDLVICWASLVSAIGIPAYLVGLAYEQSPEAFFHAQGFSEDQFFELSKDESYDGDPNKPMIRATLNSLETALLWSPYESKFYRFVVR